MDKNFLLVIKSRGWPWIKIDKCEWVVGKRKTRLKIEVKINAQFFYQSHSIIIQYLIMQLTHSTWIYLLVKNW